MSRAVPLLTERVSATQAAQNAASLAFTRTSVSVLAGSIAGVLGLTGLSGFLFYFLSVLLSAAVWLYKLNFNVKLYFPGWYSLLIDGAVSGLMSYVLFWTLLYDCVYIY